MRLSKRMVNVLGAFAVVVVLVAGVVLGALPMYSQSRAMSGEASVVATTNEAYAIQADTLRADQARLAQIQDSIDTLREEIPSVGTLDDVFEIVAAAALESRVVLESATSSPAQGWTQRPDAVSVLEAPADGVATSEPAAEEAVAEAEAEDPGTDPAAPELAVGDTPAGPEREVPFVIVVLVDSSAQAAVFLDALRVGPRLIALTHTELLAQDPGLPLRLTINALTFVRTED